LLVVNKASALISDPVNGTVNPKLMLGAIAEYAIKMRNFDGRTVDPNSVVFLNEMPVNAAIVDVSRLTVIAHTSHISNPVPKEAENGRNVASGPHFMHDKANGEDFILRDMVLVCF
jgi:hypothetical protein